MLPDPDYESYLSLLARFLRLRPSQRDEIRRELRAHMEEAIEAQLERGVPRDEAVRRALDDFGDAAELAARFSSIGGRKRWIMKGTAAAACIGFAALAFNNFPITPGPQQPAPAGLLNSETASADRQNDDDAQRDRKVFQALAKRVPEVNFKDQPLEEVMDWLGELTGVNVHVQWSRLEDNGIARDAPVSLKMSDIKIERLLRLILNDVSPDIELQHGVLDGILFISTQEDFQRNLYVEVYDVRDLLAERRTAVRTPVGPRRWDAKSAFSSWRATDDGDIRESSTPFAPWTQVGFSQAKDESVFESVTRGDTGKELVDMIQNVIAPDTWQANGGTAYIQVYHGSLVVRQSEFVHAELTRLLAALREPKKD